MGIQTNLSLEFWVLYLRLVFLGLGLLDVGLGPRFGMNSHEI